MDIDVPEPPEPPAPGLIELPDPEPEPRDYISTAAAQSRIYRTDPVDRIDHPDLAD
jgi:hypothetical protein